MAGFLDVSALLQRKTYTLDVTPGKSGEEGTNAGGVNRNAATEQNSHPKPLTGSEQRVEGKLPPRSPKSALSLQASPVGTPSSTKHVAEHSSGIAHIDTNETKGPVDNLEQSHSDQNVERSRPDEAAFEALNEEADQNSAAPRVENQVPSLGLTVNASEGGRSPREMTRTSVELQPPVREMSLPFVDATDGFEEGVSVSRTTSINNNSNLEGANTSPLLTSSSDNVQDGKVETSLENRHEGAAMPGEVLNVQGDSNLQNGGKPVEGTENETLSSEAGLTSPGKGGGRLSKVGGLLKKTLSFSRSKSGSSNEQDSPVVDNSEGERGMLGDQVREGENGPQEREKKSDVTVKEMDGADLAKDWLEAETRPSQETENHSAVEVPVTGDVGHPAPQIARSDSGRVRSLLKKLRPGGSETAEPTAPQADERVTEAPVLVNPTLPKGKSNGSVDDVRAENLKVEDREVGGVGKDVSIPVSVPNGDSNVGGLMRKQSLNHSGNRDKPVQTQADVISIVEPEGTLGKLAERASVFRIPKHMLQGQSLERKGKGTDDPPARPMVVFVDSKAASGKEAELQRELREMLGGEQVFDVAHRPPGDFLAALLSKLEDCARSGDRVATAVKDSLRVLVVGDDALFKSVTQDLQLSKAWRGIPVGYIAAGGQSHVTRVFGLGRGLDVVSKESVFELLTQAADAGTQVVDCWEVTLSNHRKRTAANLPTSLERVSVDGAKSDWILSHRGLCWGSVHLDMGYGAGHSRSKDAQNETRQSGGWMCGLCSTSAPKVIRSQNVGRLEILKEGSWSYLELSPQIQSLEFVNLAEDQQKSRRRMKMLEKGLAEVYADDGLIEIVGVQEGSDIEICLAQTNAVRLELFGNAEIDHVKLRLDSESWDQPLAGETTADPAVVQIVHGGRVPVLVPPTSTLKCTVPPVFRPSVFAPPPAEATPPERRISGLFRRRSPSPFRKGGRFRSPSPFRRKVSRRSPSPDRPSLTPDPPAASDPMPPTSEYVSRASESVPTASESDPVASDGSLGVLLRTRDGAPERTFVSPRGKRRVSSPMPGLADREGRSGSVEAQRPSEVQNAPGRYQNAPGRYADGAATGDNRRSGPGEVQNAPGSYQNGSGNYVDPATIAAIRRLGAADAQNVPGSYQNAPGGYADAATAAAKGLGKISARRAGASTVPRTLKADKMVDVERAQPQQKPVRSGGGRQEIVEPVAKTLVRTGSGRLDEYGRPQSPALYRSSSRDNLDQATLSRPASPAMYRSSSRDNLDQAGGLNRPPSPALGRQNSGNTGYSPRGTIAYPPRSESPVQFRERESTPERLPRMADWATGMSRRSASMTYNPVGVHSHLLTKQERENAVAIGLGGTLSREERERMQALAFGNASGYSGYDRATTYSGYDRATTPQRIRSARARYIGAATPVYNIRGPLELDLATSTESNSPPPPVRTARDYFSGPLTASGVSVLRRSHVL